MNKLLTVLLMSTCLSGVVAASEESSKAKTHTQSEDLLSTIFDMRLFSCDDFPDCGIDEQEQMMLAGERRKGAFTTFNKNNTKKSNKASEQ